jgi:hypothetical protein
MGQGAYFKSRGYFAPRTSSAEPIFSPWMEIIPL